MFLHEKVGVAHLDLKLENVLLGNQNELKICDVAMARDVSKPIGKKFGTEGYMAPEVAERVESDTFEAIPVDIFALGVILFIFKILRNLKKDVTDAFQIIDYTQDTHNTSRGKSTQFAIGYLG